MVRRRARLQVGVRLVLRVPPPVVRQRPGLAAEAATHVVRSRVGFRALVEVVPEMQHQVRLLLGQPAVRREPALFVVGARRHGEPGVREGPARRCRPGPPHRRDVALCTEPVVVLATGLEPVDLNVHAVRPGGVGGGVPAADHPAERRVLGDLPLHHDLPSWHASDAVGHERVWCQPGPQHHARGPGVAGGDAQGERVAEGQARTGRARRLPGPNGGDADRESGRAETVQDIAACEVDHVPRRFRGKRSTRCRRHDRPENAGRRLGPVSRFRSPHALRAHIARTSRHRSRSKDAQSAFAPPAPRYTHSEHAYRARTSESGHWTGLGELFRVAVAGGDSA